MLTYRTGAAGTPAAAQAMAEYLVKESNIAGLSDKLAAYYGHGLMSDDGTTTAGVPIQTMDQRIAGLLEIDPTRPLSTMEAAHLLDGRTASGNDIPGKDQKSSPNGVRISYVDFTLSAPKSFSVAQSLAPTEAERAILDKCHTDAVDRTLAVIAATVGTVNKGKGGRVRENAHVAVIKFEHNTARPVEKIARTENGQQVTDLVHVGFGDMQRHTHCIMPAVAITDDGRVGSIHQHAIKDRIHEWGSLYQAFLATNLRRHGVEVELDDRPNLQFQERMARLKAVPQWVNEMFSKRTVDGRHAARAYALKQGIDYDALSPEGKKAFLSSSITARRASKDAQADRRVWVAEAEAAGYRHRSVLRPGEGVGPREDRIHAAYDRALPLLEEQFEKRAVLEGSTARVAAAKALIATGIESAKDINRVTSAFRTEGVRQDGEKTPVHWAYDPSARYARLTTQLSVEQEQEAIGILREAAADKSVALSPEAVERAVRKVEAEGFDFSQGHGLRQREVIDKLASSGRAAVAIGVAGAGKSSLLHPLVEAWREDHRDIYGISLGWRQTQGLRDAGIGKRRYVADKTTLSEAGVAEEKTFAITPFLKRMEDGRLKLDRNSVVVIDEIGLVGTRQMLQIARLQKKHWFQIVGIGDDRQAQAVSAGASIDLARRAFGGENVPELLSTVRQLKERDRETSLLFREGNAREALDRKDKDGTVRIVGGGYEEAVRATVDLWEERCRVNAGREGYSLGISVPTNADGLAIGEEIHRRRMAAGEIGETLARIQASDQAGNEYRLDLSKGDRVRLFNRVFGRDEDNRNGFVGNNGTVVEVEGVDEHHLHVRRAGGDVVRVQWEDLRPEGSDRIMLTRGDAITIDARQSETLTEHIAAMPNGSAAVNGFKAYVAESRHREMSWIVTSQGAEQQEVRDRRAAGDPRNEERDPVRVREAILDNMGRNLSRQPTKTLATDFMERALHLRSGTVDAKQAAWYRQEMRELEGKPALVVPPHVTPEPLPEIIPTAEEHRIAWKAWVLVRDPDMMLTDGVSDLLDVYVKNGGDLDKIDALQERYTEMLYAAAVKTDSGAESRDIILAMREAATRAQTPQVREQRGMRV